MNSINLTQPTTHCPLCGRSNKLASLSETVNKYIRVTPLPVVGKLAYYFCPCGLYYAAAYMTEEDTHEYYAGGAYRECTSGAPGMSSNVERDELTHAANITPEIYGRVQACGSILDVGCSSGVLLEQLRDHYSLDPIVGAVVGVEWNQPLRQFCFGRSIPCFDSMDKLTGGHYDLIILSHVLEHTLDPLGLLHDIYNLLDGRLFVQVPLMMPGVPHPLVFTESSAVWMIERAGYNVISAHPVKTLDKMTEYFTIWAGKDRNSRPRPGRPRKMTEKSQDDAQLHIRLSRKDHKELKDYASKTGQTMSDFIRATAVRVAYLQLERDA